MRARSIILPSTVWAVKRRTTGSRGGTVSIQVITKKINLYNWEYIKGKGQVIPLHARCGPEGG